MKKVTFNLELNQTKLMVVWKYAAKKARMNDWEQEVMDRIRFKDRIVNLAKIINPILDFKHRCKIYKKLRK